MTTTALRGTFIAILLASFCILSTVHAQKDIDKRPFVLNANEVPVLGGLLNIYGLNFGTDPSVISVAIYDISNVGGKSGFIQCIDVKIVVPNSIISCSIVDIGTGKPKHIEVTVNGLSNANTDVNVAFKRSAPVLDVITYNNDDSEIKVYGHHFGFNPSLVVVTVDGIDHPVAFVNDSVITCNKSVEVQLPGTGNATLVSVVVDKQQTSANMTFLMETDYLTNEGLNYLGEHIQGADSTYSIRSYVTRNTIIIALIPGVAVVALVAFLVIRKRKRSFAISQRSKSADGQTQTVDSNAIIITTNMVRDNSMEEIDLNADDSASVITRASQSDMTAATTTNEPGFYELSENQRTISSSSSSSFSSPYSSCTTTPSVFTPESMRRISPSSPSVIDMSSDYEHDNRSSHDNNKNHKRNKREKQMSRIMNELPVSRLNKHSMDSPYFAKQNAFDSPLRSSCDSPVPYASSSLSSSMDHQLRSSHEFSMNDLKTSQEINQRHTNPFDSPSVLHATIQRAAILRQQQQQKQHSINNNVPPALHLLKPKAHNKRRASLGAFQPTTRRSSLSTTSLHVSALHTSFGVSNPDNILNAHEEEEEDEEICTANSLHTTQYIQPIVEESDV